MSRVEVVIEHELYAREVFRFELWMLGWLQYHRYKVVDAKVMHNNLYTVFEVEGDLFELFGKLNSEVKIVKRYLRADVVVGLCSGDECVVFEDFEPKVVVSNYVLKKLSRLVNTLRRIVGDDKVEDMSFMSGDGVVSIFMKGCSADLYVNEAFVVAADLVSFVRDVSRLRILDEVRFVYNVFNPPEPLSLDIDFITDEGGIILFVNNCSKLLTLREALYVAYWLMKLSLDQLKRWKEEEGREGGV